MPTYDYQCAECGYAASKIQSIRSYCEQPIVPECPQHNDTFMERKLSVVPAAAGSYALAGDRHYEGMRATDGTDISSRSKHRQYMKNNNLTTIDDYSKTWSKAAEERQAFRSAAHQDTSLRSDLAQALQTKTA